MAHKSTMRLFWTVLIGFALFISFVGRSQAETIELHNLSAVANKKDKLIEAFDRGHRIHLFANYILEKNSFQSDMELVMNQIAELHRDSIKAREAIKTQSQQKTESLQKNNKDLRMASTNTPSAVVSEALYNLVVEEANVRLNAQEEMERFKRMNRVALKYKTQGGMRYVTELVVVRNGKELRSNLPTVHASLENNEQSGQGFEGSGTSDFIP